MSSSHAARRRRNRALGTEAEVLGPEAPYGGTLCLYFLICKVGSVTVSTQEDYRERKSLKLWARGRCPLSPYLPPSETCGAAQASVRHRKQVASQQAGPPATEQKWKLAWVWTLRSPGATWTLKSQLWPISSLALTECEEPETKLLVGFLSCQFLRRDGHEVFS